MMKVIKIIKLKNLIEETLFLIPHLKKKANFQNIKIIEDLVILTQLKHPKEECL